MEYLILQDPGHNKVYYKESKKLCAAELSIALRSIAVESFEVSLKTLSSVDYLHLKLEKELSKEAIALISRLSFCFAIFSLKEIDGESYLKSIDKYKEEYLPEKISTILRYPGKTNELFTRMMINVALFSSDYNFSDKIKLLDPISGRGTTLYEAATAGFDVYGVEIDKNSALDCFTFFKKFLSKEKFKHKAEKHRVNPKSKELAHTVYDISYEANSDSSIGKEFKIVCGNTKDTNKFYKKESFHLVVGDLPYGVAHGNVAKKKSSKDSFTRSPKALIELAASDWFKVLKPGGVIVLAWNSFVEERSELEAVLEAKGFSILNDDIYRDFEHMVDSSIRRDIVLAKKS